MKKLYSTFTLAIFLFLTANAQNACGTDEHHVYKMAHDSSYRAWYQKQNAALTESFQSNRFNPNWNPQQIYRIPTVVHIIHLGEPIGTGSNITDATVLAAIANMNDKFRNVIGSGVDTEIEFCLATRDPNGCLTNGITRVDGSGVPLYASLGMSYTNCGADEIAVLDLARWPTTDYYNIYIVSNICGGAAGYNGGMTGYPYAGTVVQYFSLSSLTHESGHALQLAHTFAGDYNNTCPVDTNCAVDGDLVCDTPPHQSSDCGSTNPCTSLGIWANSLYNYMSYCPNHDRFTADQKTRMVATINDPQYATILNSTTCTAPPFDPLNLVVENMSCHGICDGSISVDQMAFCSPQNYSYLWNTGDTTNSISGLCAGTYTVTLTNTSSQTIVYTATIIDPAVISISTSVQPSLCSSDIVATATGGTPYVSPVLCSLVAPIVTIGTGNHLVSPTNYPAVYGNRFWGARHQILVLQSELVAAGLTTGSINSISFDVYTVLGTANIMDFNVKMKHTSMTSINSLDTGLQMVMNPQNITITTGWNTHAFNTPFVWDGVSNILVEVCFNNSSYVSQNSQIRMTFTPFNSVVYNLADVMTACSDASNQWITTARPNMRFTQCPDSLVYNYQWSDGQTTSTATGLTSGTYTLTVTDGNGCSSNTTVVINTGSTINAGNDTTIYPGNPVGIGGNPTASGFGPFTYLWSPSSGLNSNSISNPIATPLVTTTYVLTTTDVNGCSYIDSISIAVDSSLSVNSLYGQGGFLVYPNPVQDILQISSTSALNGNYHLSLVNMLGQTLLQQDVYVIDHTVQATVNLQKLSNGLYFLIIQNENSKTTIKIEKRE